MNQLANQDLKGFWGRKKFIAIDLYQELGACGLPNKERLEEAIMRRFALANGTFRRTHDARFEDFDGDAIRQIKKFFSEDELLRVHDVAVSDGRTACQFFKKLKRNFKKISYHATDRDTYVKIIESKKQPKNKIVRDEEGKLLQIIWPPFVFNIPKKESPFLYPINRLLIKLLEDKRRLNKWLKLDEKKEKRISIFSHEAQKLERDDVSFSLGAYDLFNKMPAKYDIIRVMNVLNRSYFTEEEARKIITNIKSSLKDPGILLVGSNKDAGSPVNGNIFLNKKGAFRIISTFGGGAPYKEIFLESSDKNIDLRKERSDKQTYFDPNSS